MGHGAWGIENWELKPIKLIYFDFSIANCFNKLIFVTNVILSAYLMMQRDKLGISKISGF